MITPGINLVMTVIGFGLSIMFIVFVCTRLICARIQLSASRRSLSRANRSDLSNVSIPFSTTLLQIFMSLHVRFCCRFSCLHLVQFEVDAKFYAFQ